MNPELAVLYAKLDIYEETLKEVAEGTRWDCPCGTLAQVALTEATKLSQPASQSEKP